MGDYFEAKAIGPERRHHRLFCLLDRSDDPKEMRRRGLPTSAIAVITGMWKPNATLFGAEEYAAVRRLGDDYLARLPRRIADADDVDEFLDRLAEKKAAETASKSKKTARKKRR